MGAFDEVSPVIIPNPDNPEMAEAFRKKWKWDAHEQCIIRGSYTAAAMEAVTNATLHSEMGSGKKNNITLQSGTGRIKLIECMVIRWTFAKNGQVVPINAHSIRQLPYNYQTPILEVCDDLAKDMLSEEEQSDFLNSANGLISTSQP